MIKKVSVFCGGSNGINDVFYKDAKDLGKLLAENDLQMVFGGGGNGLMGETSRAVIENGGKIQGIIPEFLLMLENGDTSNENISVVKDMHIRKAQMYNASDAFIILPGGLGTLDELFEIMVWKQINVQDKPIIIINTNGYWNFLNTVFDAILENGFAKSNIKAIAQIVNTPEEAIAKLKEYQK